MKVLSMFDGNLGKYLLPGIVLQSVMIGGGYATGREIVEYGAKFGAMGWLSGLVCRPWHYGRLCPGGSAVL